jgi:outer membrane protein assembly factor BamE (lipoprotein component of BamABCDE complex)
MIRGGSIPVAALCAAALLAGCAGAPFAPSGHERSDALFSHVVPGMSQDEVARLIGPPDDTMAFARTHTVAWDYLYFDSWGYRAEFSVTFDESGHAVSKLSKRLDRRDFDFR